MISFKKKSILGRYLRFFYGNYPTSKLGLIVTTLVAIPFIPFVVILTFWIFCIYLITGVKPLTLLNLDGYEEFHFFSIDSIFIIFILTFIICAITLLFGIFDIITIPSTTFGFITEGFPKGALIIFTFSLTCFLIKKLYFFIKKLFGGDDNIKWK